MTDRQIVIAVCDTEEKATELIARYGKSEKLYAYEKMPFNKWYVSSNL